MCNNTTQLKAGKAAKGCVLGVGADTGDAISFAVGQATSHNKFLTRPKG